MAKAFMMAALGLIFGSVGMDIVTAHYRFTYGVIALEDGLGLVPMVMGFFGIGEVLLNIENWVDYGQSLRQRSRDYFRIAKIGRGASGRLAGGPSSAFFLAILPGAGPCHCFFYVLHCREEDFETSGASSVRGEITGSSCTRSSQQCSGPVCLHPHAYPGHSQYCNHGHHARGTHHLRGAAWSFLAQRNTRTCSGGSFQVCIRGM